MKRYLDSGKLMPVTNEIVANGRKNCVVIYEEGLDENSYLFDIQTFGRVRARIATTRYKT